MTNQAFKNYGMIEGRMISGSKSLYRSMHPENVVYFNANIFTLSEGKVWWGDLDLTLDEDILKNIAESMREDLFVLREMDGRFENENITQGEIISRAIAKISK